MDDQVSSANPEADRVIEAFGGPSELARLCELTHSAVSQWRRTGIPKPWRKYLRQIKPEAFEEIA